MTTTREFDLVLFGATGFTGGLVAEYLARHPEQRELTWAIGGRNREKLAAVRDRIRSAVPDAAPAILVADASDRSALDDVARRTGVVCTTVGPYARHGSELVAACTAAGTDYCDLTGEVPWISRMIHAHHAEAQKTRARIVHCCGFDSIPSDLGVLFLQEAAHERFGRHLDEIELILTDARGAPSGGTVASILGILDEARRDPEVRRLLLDPYGLNPEGQRHGPDERDLLGVRYHRELGAWIGPFVMAAINTRIVRRGHALRGYPYGREFRYREATGFGPGARGLARAGAMTAGISAFASAALVPPVRRLIDRVVPAPGEGPDAEARRRGHFTFTLLGKGREANGAPITMRGRVAGTSDPGYGETSKMLGESALCLIATRGGAEVEGGVTTPAAALGMPLVERLRRAGMTFAVD